jgi:hypothetical protein
MSILCGNSSFALFLQLARGVYSQKATASSLPEVKDENASKGSDEIWPGLFLSACQLCCRKEPENFTTDKI